MGIEERDKLKALLNYWVEHNQEHSQEVMDWVDRVKALGEGEIATDMLQAAQVMDKASGLLSQSLKKLGEE